MRETVLRAAVSAALTALTAGVAAQTPPPPPRVLTVIAHPDDDAMFAGAVYKITHTLGGVVDLALVTDGSGGFRYAQLAEPIYGRKLTEEAVARQYLPAIRQRELMAGGAITGIRRYFFLDQYDHAYSENVDTVLAHVWDADVVRDRLSEIMRRGYDFVFVHLPIEQFHGHHKAATILALEAARRLPAGERPIVLGAMVGQKGDTSLTSYRGLANHSVTRVSGDEAPFVFDRTQRLSPDGRLDYRIVVNWLIAEHRSQGTMQLLVNVGEVERYWWFTANDPARRDAARALFAELARPVFPEAP